MQAESPNARAMRRRAFTTRDLVVLIVCLVIGLGVVAVLGTLVLTPSLARAREMAKRSVCAANLRGIGQSMHIYARDNQEWFPQHYYQPTYTVEDLKQRPIPREHGVSWIGAMGSSESLRITEATSKTKSPTRSHPSRSLFLLITTGYATPIQFICPSSGDRVDPLRNRSGSGATTARIGIDRFDFEGYSNLSYGYQLPYGPLGKPRAGMDPRMPIAADKGPYFQAGEQGLDGTVPDQRSAVNPPADLARRSTNEILKSPASSWRPYNSRNHHGEGQNVLFVDSHFEFTKKPIVGINYDNLYTMQSAYTLSGALIGLIPGEGQLLGPLTNTDSFIVP